MASTSTGYAPALISKEQPSSSGQVMRFSSGCTLAINDDAEVKLESGSRLRFSSVNETSAVNLKLDCCGVSVIKPTTKWLSTSTGANAYISEPPAAGIQKTIIVRGTTKVVEVAASTAKARHFCSSSTKGHTLKIQPTTEVKRYGVRVDLMSISTAMWNVSCPIPPHGSTGWDACTTITTSTME